MLVSHRVAPLSVLRACAFFSDEEKIAALKIKSRKSILEDVYLQPATGQSSCPGLLISYLLVSYWLKHFLASVVSDRY